MGFFWDLLQQYQIGQRQNESNTLADYVADLEERVQALEAAMSEIATELDNRDQSDRVSGSALPQA